MSFKFQLIWIVRHTMQHLAFMQNHHPLWYPLILPFTLLSGVGVTIYFTCKFHWDKLVFYTDRPCITMLRWADTQQNLLRLHLLNFKSSILWIKNSQCDLRTQPISHCRTSLIITWRSRLMTAEVWMNSTSSPLHNVHIKGHCLSVPYAPGIQRRYINHCRRWIFLWYYTRRLFRTSLLL